MRIYDIIKKKRDGFSLTKEEINYFIDSLCQEKIEDYQTSALLMAMYLNGLSDEETANLTAAMMNSGDLIDLSEIKGIKVDKHSTGGVGDTTTLIVAPILASLGIPMAKMSGRGLGHTGGTLDKLESIPNFNISLSSEEFIDSVNDIGLAIIGQTKNIAPADKRLYALRDVTATVENFGLIASSIMSKKLASGSDAIVLDVKCGDGAFMKNLDDAKSLAEALYKIAKAMDKKISILISDMSQPLGKSIGNSLEVIEALEVLKGRGTKELREVALQLATELLVLATKEGMNRELAYKQVNDALDSGKALDKFREFVKNQGGDISVCEDYSLFKQAKFIVEVKSKKSGYISKISCEKLGLISTQLGAGRKTYQDKIDMSAGIVLNKKICDYVDQDEILGTLYTDKKEILEDMINEFYSCINISEKNINEYKLILEKI